MSAELVLQCRDIDLEQDLLFALNTQEQFFCLFQPLFKEDGNVYSFEALSRWRHPSGTEIKPDLFIPLLNNYSLQLAFLKKVIINSVSFLKQAAQDNRSLMPVHVNVQPSLYSNDNFSIDINKFFDQIEFNGYDIREHLIFELTEENPGSNTIEVSVKDIGVSVYMDDFGKGYSNLAALSGKPSFTGIKIDKSLTDHKTDICRLTVLFLLNLSQSNNFNVVAEGIEEKEQLEALKGWGVKIFQGYHLSKPLMPDSALQLLRKSGR